MTEPNEPNGTNEPRDQPGWQDSGQNHGQNQGQNQGQQYPGAPQYPNAQQYPNAPQHAQYPGTQQYPQYPGAQQYPNPQFGAAPPPGYPNAQYGTTPYGNAPYGSPQYGNAAYGGYAPYGYPYGYNAQRLGTSGMAIASLILGICGFLCVTPFVGLGLGIAALSRVKKTGQPGKGMAIAGIVLSSVWIALMILLLATGNFHLNVGNGSGTGPSVEPTQGPDGTSA